MRSMISVIGVLALIGWTAGCGDDPNAIKIAVAGPFSGDAGGEKARAMQRAFREKYQEDPDCWAALTYDAVGLAAQVIAKAGTDRKAIRDALAGMQTQEAGYEGVTGVTYFDANRECQRPAYIATVRSGRIVAAPVQMVD